MKALLDLAIRAALEGGREILTVYEGDFDVEFKLDQSPVTIADKNSNERILEVLNGAAIPVLSEESENRPYHERHDWQKFWLVDPLDGTKQFIRRNDEFTVNIALVDKDLGPVMGILYLPVSGKLYYSTKGGGAWMHINAKDHEPTEIVGSSVQLKRKSESVPVIAVNRSSGQSQQMDSFVDSVRRRHQADPMIITAGSALKFGWIAESRAMYYPRFKPSMEWDTAAGHAIVKELGYTVVNAETKTELLYNKSSLLNPSFIVCRPEYL